MNRNPQQRSRCDNGIFWGIFAKIFEARKGLGAFLNFIKNNQRSAPPNNLACLKTDDSHETVIS